LRNRWKLIKAGFSRSIAPGEWIRARRQRKSQRGLWQRRFWEHWIADEGGLRRCLDYVVGRHRQAQTCLPRGDLDVLGLARRVRNRCGLSDYGAGQKAGQFQHIAQFPEGKAGDWLAQARRKLSSGQ
jgi:hypothetical protein